jgi:hypothetical protein
MGIIFIFIFGLLSVLILIVFSNSILEVLREKNHLEYFLRGKKVFQHYWLAGIILFLMNALVFFLTMIILYVIQSFSIPFMHLVVMLLAVASSIYFWLLVNLNWQGEAKDRIKVGVIGSSFYLFLTVFFIFKYVTIKPMFPGDDTFMKSIGFMFGIMITSVAFVTCFSLTGLVRGKLNR